MDRNFECFLGCDAEYKDASIVLFGAPYDSTTSYRPGARFGPHAIRSESFGIETYSIYQDKDLTDLKIFDAGDIELPFGDAARPLEMIEEMTKTIIDDGKMPFMFGGEHLVTLGAVRAFAKKYPDLCVIHLDAHSDMRDDYLGVKLSHACVLRRCWDILGDGRIFQFGIRSGDRSEIEFSDKHIYSEHFKIESVPIIAKQIKKSPVYLTVDLDVLDPSVFPGTGTPEAGGITYPQLMSGLKAMTGMNIVGMDIVELAPMLDPTGISTATACKIVREMCLLFGKK